MGGLKDEIDDIIEEGIIVVKHMHTSDTYQLKDSAKAEILSKIKNGDYPMTTSNQSHRRRYGKLKVIMLALSKNRRISGGTAMDLTQQQIQEIIDKYKASLPVKVGTLAQDLGITVIATDELPEGISGSFSKEDGHYVIYVDGGTSVARQRFTIAHELGHFYRHRDDLESGQEILNPSKKERVVMQRPNRSSHSIEDPEVRRKEIEADEFAADLLMPEGKFSEIWKQSKRVKEVADFFKVSPIAANIRAMNLQLGYFD